MKTLLLGALALTSVLSTNSFAQYGNECRIKHRGGSYPYAVYINGNKESNNFSTFQSALSKLNEFYSYGLCEKPYPITDCKIKHRGGSYPYAIYINGNKESNNFSTFQSARSLATKMINNGLCYQQIPQYKCEIKHRGGSYPYAVYINGNKESNNFSSLSSANSMRNKLIAAGSCTSNDYALPGQGGWDPQPLPPRGQQGDYYNSLGFHFKDRALFIATTVINVSKSLEGFVNNAQERELDNIKKQAIRLRSRINGRRSLNVVRNTLFHLGTLLDNAAVFIDSSLETDRLDHLAESYLTSYESIKSMVHFLDDDFEGTYSDLY